MPSLDRTDRQYGWRKRIAVTANNLLQCNYNVRCNKHSICSELRSRGVTALPFYRDIDFICTRHHHTWPEAEFAYVQTGMYMQAEYSRGCRIFQHSFFDEYARSPGIPFFTGLKDQFYCS